MKNKKGGRPRLDGGSRKTHVVKTMLSDTEYEKMQHDMEKAKLKPASFVRKLITHVQIKEALTPEERKMILGLHNLGKNLWRIYEKTPSDYQKYFMETHLAAVQRLYEIIDNIYSKL